LYYYYFLSFIFTLIFSPFFLRYNIVLPISLFLSDQISICLTLSCPTFLFFSPNCVFSLFFHSLLSPPSPPQLPLPFTSLLLPPPHSLLYYTNSTHYPHCPIPLKSLTKASSPKTTKLHLNTIGPYCFIALTLNTTSPLTSSPLLPSPLAPSI
jgi:hypothetical protein